MFHGTSVYPLKCSQIELKLFFLPIELVHEPDHFDNGEVWIINIIWLTVNVNYISGHSSRYPNKYYLSYFMTINVRV